MGVSLLCGFGFAGKDYVYKQFETAEPVAGVLVKDASAYVTIRTADTDHITVRYAELPEGEPLYDISVQNGRLVVESREDIDVDTTDDGGFALVRVSVEGHSVSGPKRELTITLPDKQYDQLEAGSVSIENLNAEEQLSIGSAVGSASLKQVTAGDIAIGSVIGRVKLEDVRARSYSEVGFIMKTSGRVQKIR